MSQKPAIRIGDQVLLHYRLAGNGEEIVNTFSGQPETFRIGANDIDPRLEALLIGLHADDHCTYDLDAGATFGDRQAGMVHDLPRIDFAPDTALLPGNEVEFTLPNRQTLTGVIREVGDETVRVDFNHPLAGLPILFEVKIMSIQTQTQTQTQAD